MSYGFKTPQPEKKEAPKLESSGLVAYHHEIKIDDGQTVKLLPLHRLDECFSINVHRKTFNYDGLGFRYIPVGDKNTHLDFLNPPVKGSPFQSDPDKDIKNWKTARYMLFYVLDAPETDKVKCKGHVAFLELKDNFTRKDGSYNILLGWETDNDESVQGHIINYTRNGSGIRDTTYRTTVGKAQSLTPEQLEVVNREVEEVQEYILNLFKREWTLEEYRRIYNQVVLSQRNAVDENPHPVLDTEPVDETEIPF